MAVYNKNAAAKARARMASRARRQRFFKEHKKNLILAFCGFLGILALAFLTPWGPNWYWDKIQQTKMIGAGEVRPGVLKELYNLGMFYNWTMRPKEGAKCFDEIGTLFYGFKFTDYAYDAPKTEEAWEKNLANIKKGLGSGPPFKVDDSDIKYVGMAMYQAGLYVVVALNAKKAQFDLYTMLYQGEFQEKYPRYCEQEVTTEVNDTVDRYLGRK